jgi:hypothetical protein
MDQSQSTEARARIERLSPWERTMRERRIDRYGVVLVLLIATIAVNTLGPTTPLTTAAAILLGAMTLIFCVNASDVGIRTLTTARVIAGLAVVASIVISVTGSAELAARVNSVVGASLAFLLPIPIARRVRRQPQVTFATVAAALCLYFLAGIGFAYLYGAIDTFGGPVFNQVATATTADTTYFSFVTLATLGYGDLTPATSWARLLSIFEAVGGQLYLVTIIALLVANIGRTRTVLTPDE